MKKALRYLVLGCLMALTLLTAKAQILILDDEEGALSNRSGAPADVIPIPPMDLENDWIPGQAPEYTPLGGGVLALGLLGGAYLLRKKRRK